MYIIHNLCNTMSPPAVAIFINPPPILNKSRKFNNNHPGIPFSSPIFRTLKQSVRFGKTMATGSTETGIVGGGDERISPAVSAFEQEALLDNDGGGGGSFLQTAGGLHALLNRLSKWVIAVSFGGVILLRHDAAALWAAMGSVVNVILSVTLKRILKQQRPVSQASSGPGMPSSHAQSIFFIIIFILLSVVEWQRLNGVTAFLSMLVVAIGCYFSWLRVLERYHTTSQVIVGAIVGSIFSVLWFWAWEASVVKAYNASLWVRMIVVVGAACFSFGAFSPVFRYWINDVHHS